MTAQPSIAQPSGNQPSLKLLISHPAYFFGLGFGTGLVPKAPGTVGTLLGLALFWLISGCGFATQLSIVAALFIAGIYFCTTTGRALGVPDHGAIVWDEIVAMMLVLSFTPKSSVFWLLAFA